jgi:methyl-accepting chemotaxis protein
MKNLSIRLKLIMLVLFLSIALVVVGLVGNYGIQKTSESLDQIGHTRLPSIIGLSIINEGQTAIRLANRDMLLYQNDYNAQAKFAEIIKNKQKIFERIDKGWAIYEPLPQEPEEAEVWREFVPAWNLWKQGQLEVNATLEALTKNQGEEGQKALFLANLKQSEARKVQAANAKNLLNKLVELNQQYAINDNKVAQESVSLSRLLMVIAGTVSVLMALYLGFGLIRAITRPLELCIDVAQKIADGDLSSVITVDSQDETGQLLKALQDMQSVLRHVVADIEAIVGAAVNGDFSKQIDVNNHKGYAKDLSLALNKLSYTTSTSFNDVTRVADALADGDLSQRITEDYSGVFGQIKISINHTADSLAKMIAEIQYIVDTATQQGDFSVKIDMADKRGYNHTLSERLNQLCELTDTGLNDILQLADALSKGDLTHNMTRDYSGTFGQVKAAMTSTVANLRLLVADIKNSTDAVHMASKEISEGNIDLSQRTEEQAASLEQTAASMEELTTTVQANTENAKEASQLGIEASKIADKGVASIKQVIRVMSDINESSREISDILSVIEGIAFQTNILALNAAVEAARAGAQGRGFAVVAEEVRSLAQSSTTAALKIKSIIGNSEKKMYDGNKLVDEAAHTMQDIADSIQQVSSIIFNITGASIEQSDGISELNLAISQMDEITQQNASLVEEIAAVSKSMEEQAENLSTSVEVFKIH